MTTNHHIRRREWKYWNLSMSLHRVLASKLSGVIVFHVRIRIQALTPHRHRNTVTVPSNDGRIGSSQLALTRNRRYWITACLAAIPLEVVAALMLPYVPHVGVPRNPNPSLIFAGDISALTHAPGLLLSDFFCIKFRISPHSLMPMVILIGYVDLLTIIFLAHRFFRGPFTRTPSLPRKQWL